MLLTYIVETYPDGKVRTARASHICNGGLGGTDPGCGGQINTGQKYFDTGERGENYRAGRFCRHCAMMESACSDLFDIADNRQTTS